MSEPEKKRLSPAGILYHARHFALFMLVVILFVQSSALILLNAMQIDEAVVRRNAPLALLNLLLLGAVFFVLDNLRRRYMVDRHVRRITQGLKRIQEGDFSVRIAPIDPGTSFNELDQVIAGINRMTQELSGVETLRTDFLSNVSHELKTPLAVIGNYATLLQNPAITQAQREEYARAVSDGAARLSSLVTNILKLNKLENQQIYPAAAAYNLSEQLCECILGFEQALEEKALALDTDIADGVVVCADRELLSLVWNNLLSNAIKFTERGGTIACSLRAEGPQAVATISDTGCGMSAETGARIFENWLAALGVYYAVLALIRFLLLRRLTGAPAGTGSPALRHRACRTTGVMLLVLGVVMTAIIFQVVRDNQTFRYPGSIIYAFGAYAFYKIIMATVNLIRRRGRDDPLLAAARCLSLATAMVSVFSLQTAMLSTFGAEQPAFRLMANAASGAAVCLGILLIAVAMIIRSTRALRALLTPIHHTMTPFEGGIL